MSDKPILFSGAPTLGGPKGLNLVDLDALEQDMADKYRLPYGVGDAVVRDLIAEVRELRADSLLRQATEALRNIANSDVPRPVATTFRSDGAASKHDKCAHDVAMYEDCGNCIAEYARTVLAATVLTAYDKRSA